jgi:hypothetical protein
MLLEAAIFVATGIISTITAQVRVEVWLLARVSSLTPRYGLGYVTPFLRLTS